MDGKTQTHRRPHVLICNSKQPAWASPAAAVDMLWVQTSIHVLLTLEML